MAEAAKEKGAIFVDAPVSGGVNAAAAGTLTFMVGADKVEEFEAAQKILAFMGKSITHCGQVGTGQAVKICNNMLLAISMIGVSETMNLGINLGLDPKLLTSILSSATGRCWSVDTYNPVPGVMPNVPSSNSYQVVIYWKEFQAVTSFWVFFSCGDLVRLNLHIYIFDKCS